MPATTLIDTQPHSLAAERTVIGALLIDPDKIVDIAPIVSPKDFYDPTYRQIFEAAWQLYQDGQPIDFVTVSARLADNKKVCEIGGSAFLAEIAAEVPTASHATKYAQIVRDKSLRLQLVRVGSAISGFGYDQAEPASALLEKSEQQILQLSYQASAQHPVSLADMRAERFDRYTMLFEADDPAEQCGTRTGFPALDHKLTAMAPGHFIVLAGRPSMGKTSIALDIARNVALQQEKAVGILSLEMTKEEGFDRIFGSVSGIPPWKLSKGLLEEDEFAGMGSAMDRLAEARIFVDDDSNRTFVNLRSKARRLQMQHGLDLLIIDYLQLIQVTDRFARENRTREMSFVCEHIKELARELHCPILALSQLNRDCERRPDKRPQLSDLRDSGSLEQDADRVLMLYRDGYYDEDCDDPTLTELYVRKNRHGPTGLVELQFNEQRMSFSDGSK